MVGTCIMCSKEIFKFVKGVAVYPMGNYRSMVFIKEDGGKLEAPFCMDCHDSFEEKDIPEFAKKLYQYMKKVSAYSADNYKKLKLVSFQLKGPLKSKELEGGVRIWR